MQIVIKLVQEIERNISEVKSKNKEANLNDKEEENIDFKIESENEKFDEIVERAIQNEEVDYSKLFACEDKEDVKEYALNSEIVERAVQNEKVDYFDLFAYEDKKRMLKSLFLMIQKQLNLKLIVMVNLLLTMSK